MSTVKINRIQIGQSGTATQNFTLDASAANGTVKLSRGNAGATTQDIISVATDGTVDFPTGLSAFLGANQSLAANGYQKLPGGLIVQWGSGLGSTSGGVPVVYPIAFPNACYAVVASSGSSGASIANLKTYGIGLTQFSVAILTDNGSVVTSYFADPFQWIAIGK